MSPRSVWADSEILDAVERDATLLAIADAVSYSLDAQPTAVGSLLRTERRTRRLNRWPRKRAATMATAFAAVLVIAIVGAIAPWSSSGNGSLASRALAALGTGPVIHVVVEQPSDISSTDIQSGETAKLSERVETWYDAARGLRHDVITRGSTTIADQITYVGGGQSESGPVYTCSWIQTHPQSAAQANVSCPPETGGTTVDSSIPSLDPGLADFVDSYRSALQSGAAKMTSQGTVDGVAVRWLSLPSSSGQTEQVAVDESSMKPVLVRSDGQPDRRVTSIETIAPDAANLNSPIPVSEPYHGDVVDSQTIGVDASDLQAQGTPVVWAGQTISQLTLATAQSDVLKTSFSDPATTPKSGAGVELTYRDPSNPRSYVRLLEATTPEFAYMWTPDVAAEVMPGRLYSGVPGAGLMRIGATYVTIQASDPGLILPVARALAPISPR